MHSRQFKVESSNILLEPTNLFRVFVSVLILFFTPAAVAQVNGRSTVDLVYEIGESRFSLARHLLRAASDEVARNSDANARQGHLALRNILDGDPMFRSILALNENGELMYDSYNVDPFVPPKDLSDRNYFRAATNQAHRDMLILPPIVGRQSGEYFIPLSMPVPNAERRSQKVVMVTAPASSFIPEVQVCAFCGIILVLNGDIISSNRPMSEVNEAVISRLSFAGFYGAKRMAVRGMAVSVFWRTSEASGVTYLFYSASPQPIE